MDEILIGEKKYISSKLAAKATGYAKDYIGQLCREGRVPARLVGRSWYVLESAVHDHRFGTPKSEPVIEEKPPAFQSTWESPRYEASDAEALPSVNRLRERESAEPAEDKDQEVSQRLQETWQAWFDRFDHVAEVAATGPAEVNEKKEEEKEPEIELEQEVKVPIHTVYQLPREEQKPEVEEEADEPAIAVRGRESGLIRKLVGALRVSAVLIATVSAVAAAFGSGYLDDYALSNSQARIIAGVALYNK